MSGLTLKGPYWVAARQHRRALWAVPAVVAAALVAVIALRIGAGDTDTGGGAGVAWTNDGYLLLRICMEKAATGLLFLPLLVGAFVAGPMTARELESGTWRLALTQSSTPKAWLGSKVGVAAIVSLLGSAAFVAVYRIGWARVTGTYRFHWADRGTYEATGPVLAAYCLLGVAVGVLIGQLVRRTLAAMALTGILTGLVMLALGALRWSILPVETGTVPLSGHASQAMPYSALMIDTGLVTSRGEHLPEYVCSERFQDTVSCPAGIDVTGRYAEFHPVSHYWPTQLVESSLVLVLAGVALFAAFRLVAARRA